MFAVIACPPVLVGAVVIEVIVAVGVCTSVIIRAEVDVEPVIVFCTAVLVEAEVIDGDAVILVATVVAGVLA